MILRRTINDIGGSEKGEHIVCSYSGSGFALLPVLRPTVGECDQAIRKTLSGLGVSVSQIIAAELCTEEKLLVALAETQDKLSRLVQAVELFVGDQEGVLQTPEQYNHSWYTEEEREQYRTFYNAALEASGVCCEVESLLRRVERCPDVPVCSLCGSARWGRGCKCGGGDRVLSTAYIFGAIRHNDTPEGEKDNGTNNG